MPLNDSVPDRGWDFSTLSRYFFGEGGGCILKVSDIVRKHWDMQKSQAYLEIFISPAFLYWSSSAFSTLLSWINTQFYATSNAVHRIPPLKSVFHITNSAKAVIFFFKMADACNIQAPESSSPTPITTRTFWTFLCMSEWSKLVFFQNDRRHLEGFSRYLENILWYLEHFRRTFGRFYELFEACRGAEDKKMYSLSKGNRTIMAAYWFPADPFSLILWTFTFVSVTQRYWPVKPFFC